MNLEVFCKQWLAAWTGNRPQELISFYTDDAFYRDPAHPSGLAGRVALLAYFEKLLAKNPDWVWQAEELIPTARGFTLKWQAQIPTPAAIEKIAGLDIVELAGGRISRNEVYFDPTVLATPPPAATPLQQPPRILETPRLILRPHQSAQLDSLAAMWAEPQVVRYISGIPSTRTESWFRMLHYAGLWTHLGYGYWAIFEKATGRFIGDLGFADFKRDIKPSLEGIPELGWVLTPTAQGQGYATEGVRAALAWSDQYLQSARTVCIIDPQNGASRRVAEKCGFREVMLTQFKGLPSLLYERWKDRTPALP